MTLTGLALRGGIGSRARAKAGAILLALAAGAFSWLIAAGAADAGSVFMKNGYIIQGPIVEHSEAAVVLGWPNGKLTIFRRFVEKVDFEPGEEKKVSALPEASVPQVEEVVRVEPLEDDLPSDLTALVKQYSLPTALIESRLPSGAGEPQAGETPGGEAATVEPSATAVPAPPGGETAPGVEAVAVQPHPTTGAVPPDAATTTSAGDPSWGFTLQAPAGWRVARVEGCVSWTGEPAASGFAPSLNVTSVRRGSLKWEEACRALREDQKTPLKNYELITEEAVEIGGLPAFQVVGKGESGTGPGSRVVVRQVILEKGDRLWLLSTFQDAALEEKLAILIDRSLQTFKLAD